MGGSESKNPKPIEKSTPAPVKKPTPTPTPIQKSTPSVKSMFNAGDYVIYHKNDQNNSLSNIKNDNPTSFEIGQILHIDENENPPKCTIQNMNDDIVYRAINSLRALPKKEYNFGESIFIWYDGGWCQGNFAGKTANGLEVFVEISFDQTIQIPIHYIKWNNPNYEKELEKKKQLEQQEKEKKQLQYKLEQEKKLKEQQQKDNYLKQQQLKKQQELKEQEAQQEESDAAETLLRLLTSAVIITKFGFELASNENKNKVNNYLLQVQPNGSTSLRDAIAQGILRMIKLKQCMDELGIFKRKYIHVVLTDGEDTKSKLSSYELKTTAAIIGKELGDACKTFFIGVNLNDIAQRELEEISTIGGDSTQLYNISDVQISDIFERIQIEIGLRERVAVIAKDDEALILRQRGIELGVKVNDFLVLFTLDISGSMAGGRWKRVYNSIKIFLEGMKETDIFGIVLFNDKAQFITGKTEDDEE